MDPADATLVVLAEDLETNLVFTTDRTDFAICRWRRRRSFRVVLRTRIHPVWRASSAFGSCDVPQERVSLARGILGALRACGCPPAGRLRALATIFMNSPG